MHKLLSGLLSCLLVLSSCAVFKSRDTRNGLKISREVSQSAIFSRAFTGFTLLDPATGKTLADFNGERYFTPASNTKILTLATCLEVLGDSVPGMQVDLSANGNVYFRGVGDPTFLHPKFQAWQPVFKFLQSKERTPVYLAGRRFDDERFGPGWAWDDYNAYFQAERSDLPIYGNCVRFTVSEDSLSRLKVDPAYYQKQLFKRTWPQNGEKLVRQEFGDQWYMTDDFSLKKSEEIYIPFRTGWLIPYTTGEIVDLLQDTFNVKLQHIWYTPPQSKWQTLYATPLDTVLRRMMHQSDNFIAEQMLLVCAGLKFDLLQQDTMIRWMLDSTLTNLSQRPKWVDGSGLSRYNLMTPLSIAQVLLKLWKEQPKERLLSLFPAGGVSGTIADWYAGKDGEPFVFAKTGGMSGIQCLSGFIKCKRGKVLIFSFMHNNFVGSSRAWKAEMQRILAQIHGKF